MKKLLLALLLTLALHPAAFGQRPRLMQWVGESPLDYTTKPQRNIFNLPELRGPLVKLMGRAGLRRMIEDFELTQAIDYIDGYLLITGHTKRREPDAAYLVAVNVWNGRVYLARSMEGHAAEWQSTDAERARPPLEDCIISRYVTTEERPGSIY